MISESSSTIPTYRFVSCPRHHKALDSLDVNLLSEDIIHVVHEVPHNSRVADPSNERSGSVEVLGSI